MKINKTINVKQKPTVKQIKELETIKKVPIIYDEDSPELSKEELKEFKRVSEIKKDERKKEIISLRLSKKAIKKARMLGKGYTSVLSRILENALNDNEIIKRNL